MLWGALRLQGRGVMGSDHYLARKMMSAPNQPGEAGFELRNFTRAVGVDGTV